MSLSAEFLDILRCPESKGELVYFPQGETGDGAGFLFCPASRLRYPIDEHGVPVMLVDEADRLDEAGCQRVLDRARQLGLPVPKAGS